MNDVTGLDKELAELKGFIAELKTDRAAQKEKEQRESWISLFQIAIALGSICLVTKKKPLWYLSLLVAGIGTAKMIQVWFT